MPKADRTLQRRQRRATERSERLARELATREAVAVADDNRARLLAAAHSLQPVTDAAGRTIRGARIVVDFASDGTPRPRRASVLDRMRRFSDARQSKGLGVLITKEGLRAAEKLQGDYSEAGAGITVSASVYMRLLGAGGGSNGGAPATGSIAHQIAVRARLEGAIDWLGPLTDIVVPVVLDGIGVEQWATEHRQNPEQAVGYLAAALRHLARYYRPKTVGDQIADALGKLALDGQDSSLTRSD